MNLEIKRGGGNMKARKADFRTTNVSMWRDKMILLYQSPNGNIPGKTPCEGVY